MNFSRKNPPTSIEEILKFEAQRGILLPDSYRKLLLQHNGGTTSAESCYVDIPGWNELLVNEIFGLTDTVETSLLYRRFSNFSSDIEARLLVFGHDIAGQRLVLDLRSGTYGKVYVRNHVYAHRGPLLIDDTGFAPEDYEEAELFVPIADSFEAFIAMLGPEPN